MHACSLPKNISLSLFLFSYKSDYQDGLSLQCLASILFMYFAVLAPVVTFGGLLGEATGNSISVIEALLGALLVGVAYGLFSGQPLSILGPTGPILVFEGIIYNLCQNFGWEYLPFRLCVGIWVGIILLVCVATDASAVVCYITRFTEENFALLIAVIFIKSAIEKVIGLQSDFPLKPDQCNVCIPTNTSGYNLDTTGFNFTMDTTQVLGYNRYNCTIEYNQTTITGTNCIYKENVFLTSILLFIGTFAITMFLKGFRASNFFPAKIRSFLSDFAVIIAMVVMTGVDIYMEVETPKLKVPATFSPTLERSWLINPLGSGNPWWSCLFAFLPAMLATILVFMDQQITVVIVNRKEHLLKVIKELPRLILLM